MQRCNQRLIILGPFHRPNSNSGSDIEDQDEDYPTVLQDMTDQEIIDFVARLNNLHDTHVRSPLEIAPDKSSFHLASPISDELGPRTRKHLEQIGSIIGQLVQLELLQNNTCFVEMGAGRGQLGHELYGCVKDDPTVHIALIERDHQRYRYDSYHRIQGQGPSFQRYRIDIRDLHLPELPAISQVEPRPHIVIISKHLCGSATDLALRCARHAHQVNGQVRAVIIALCCHHRVVWNDYVGKRFFHRTNLTSKDFSVIRALTSWCTSENRHRLPEEAKRATIGKSSLLIIHSSYSSHVLNLDGIVFEITSTTPNERSRYSKQRLFTIEQQEQIGLKAKRLLDWGRLEYMQNHGFEAYLQVYASKSITLENIALIARPKSS